MEKTLTSGGNVRFVASHPVLVDVARDMSWALRRPLSGPVVVHVGVHRNKPITRDDAAPRIGIQTEQILDAGGRPMWKAPSAETLADILGRFDAVLDLSELNAPAYAGLPAALRRKLRLGPHIFPSVPPAFRPGADGAVFAGTVNARRAGLLAEIGARMPVTKAPPRTFGRDLNRMLDDASGMLNLHFAEGTYTEYPRLLKAVLNGKVFLSEPLAPPLVMGQHYLPPDAAPDPGRAAAVFAALAGLMCGSYSLHACLQSVLDDLAAEARA